MIYDVAIIIAIITGLVEVAKRLGLNSKWCPVLAVVIGLGLSFLNAYGGTAQTIIQGIIMGLTSVGLYSGVKNTIKK